MISRRNIRVKVMQVIYEKLTKESIEEKTDPVENLRRLLDKTTGLFVYLVYFLTRVALYAATDARLRASKNLPNEEDLNVNTKITGNEVLLRILESPSFKLATSKSSIEFPETNELVRRIYQELTASELYQQYISEPGRKRESEQAILAYIFTDLMLPSEIFTAHAEEYFTNWDDDILMLQQLLLSYLQKPGGYHLQQLTGEEKWKFAKDLLVTTLEKREYAFSLIKPKLHNWDAERIAALDMILMQMGVCEFLYFETIPPKVTINEYIDLAKEYSTPQSGQFINGILDNIHKDLLTQNKIHKIDFKKRTSS